MQELLRPVIEEYATRLAAEPEVRAITEQVDRYQDRTKGVRRLPRRKSSKRRAKDGGSQ